MSEVLVLHISITQAHHSTKFHAQDHVPRDNVQQDKQQDKPQKLLEELEQPMIEIANQSCSPLSNLTNKVVGMVICESINSGALFGIFESSKSHSSRSR